MVVCALPQLIGWQLFVQLLVERTRSFVVRLGFQVGRVFTVVRCLSAVERILCCGKTPCCCFFLGRVSILGGCLLLQQIKFFAVQIGQRAQVLVVGSSKDYFCVSVLDFEGGNARVQVLPDFGDVPAL